MYLSEMYSIKAGPPIVRTVGNWSEEKGLIVKTPNIWERRSDLMGTHLLCITIDFSIITRVQHDTKSGNLTAVTGLFQARMPDEQLLPL
jgi:hypothetical protein